MEHSEDVIMDQSLDLMLETLENLQIETMVAGEHAISFPLGVEVEIRGEKFIYRVPCTYTVEPEIKAGILLGQILIEPGTPWRETVAAFSTVEVGSGRTLLGKVVSMGDLALYQLPLMLDDDYLTAPETIENLLMAAAHDLAVVYQALTGLADERRITATVQSDLKH